MRDSNQYIVISADKLTADAPGDLGDAGPEAMDHFVMWRYRGATDFAGNAKFLREETIEFSGARVDCYVVAVFPNAKTAYTWWVAKNRYVILREDDAGNSAVFKTIKLNEPLADDLFQFVPPAGARKIELQ